MDSVEKWDLSADEVAGIGDLLSSLMAQFNSVEDPRFLRSVTTFAHELPRGLRARMNEFRLLESAGLLLISGLPVDDRRIGPTPAHWRNRPERSPALAEEMFFVLCASLLGDVFGWATQQDGHLMHEVLPIAGDETKQLSSASQTLIDWHVEDAFHQFRADYVGLMCLRNDDGTETTYAPIEWVELDDDVVDVLFEPRFTIRPDESHTAHRSEGDQAAVRRYAGIEKLRASPEQVSVLFGPRSSPYIRADPFFMDGMAADLQAALEHLVAAVDKELRSVVLRPGDVLLVDNYRVVHGRKPFVARYDGRDRWLKRLNIARDLRKSRTARLTAESRTIL
jgi:Fe(II)/alpha-ketoglutarate-dependent arginine beta-hydroxylase